MLDASYGRTLIMYHALNYLLQFCREEIDILNNLFQFFIFGSMAFIFILGIRRLYKGRKALKRTPFGKLDKLAKNEFMPDDTLELITAKTLYTAVKEYKAKPNESYSKVFLIDATRQLAENYFESKFSQPISMCSNLLPPLGFIGTVLGMVIIFVAKGQAGHDLNLEGLSVALLTTLFALVFFVMLETTKMYLCRRAADRIDSGLKITI